MKRSTVLLLVVSFITNFAIAQKSNLNVTPSTSAIKNLIVALNSDNNGLKRSAVYFAGYNKISETVDQLIDLLHSSNDDLSMKTLAAYALHQIGNEECMDALKDAASHSGDIRLCSKCKLMYEDLLKVKSGIAYQS